MAGPGNYRSVLATTTLQAKLSGIHLGDLPIRQLQEALAQRIRDSGAFRDFALSVAAFEGCVFVAVQAVHWADGDDDADLPVTLEDLLACLPAEVRDKVTREDQEPAGTVPGFGAELLVVATAEEAAGDPKGQDLWRAQVSLPLEQRPPQAWTPKIYSAAAGRLLPCTCFDWSEGQLNLVVQGLTHSTDALKVFLATDEPRGSAMLCAPATVLVVPSQGLAAALAAEPGAAVDAACLLSLPNSPGQVTGSGSPLLIECCEALLQFAEANGHDDLRSWIEGSLRPRAAAASVPSRPRGDLEEDFEREFLGRRASHHFWTSVIFEVLSLAWYWVMPVPNFVM